MGSNFQGKKLCQFIVVSHINLGCLIKEKNSFPPELILSYKGRPHFEKTSSFGKQKGSHKNCYPLKTWWIILEVYPYTLRIGLEMLSKNLNGQNKVFSQKHCFGH